MALKQKVERIRGIYCLRKAHCFREAGNLYLCCYQNNCKERSRFHEAVSWFHNMAGYCDKNSSIATPEQLILHGFL